MIRLVLKSTGNQEAVIHGAQGTPYACYAYTGGRPVPPISDPEENVMLTRKIKRFNAAILLLLLPVLLNACAGVVGQPASNTVINEYMLTEAGFGKLDVNDTTPNRQALWDASMPGKFITYYVGGRKYYVYAERVSNALFIGDEAAYQRFQTKVGDKNLCQALDATDSSAFWSCYQEFQKGGPR